MYRRLRGLGIANLERCFEANGIAPDTVDLGSRYDDTLFPGENIALVTARYGIRTTRAQAAILAYWRDMSTQAAERDRNAYTRPVDG